MTDTLKIPRAAIQYTNQDPKHRRDKNDRMSKFLVKSKTVDSLPTEGNNFETFFNDLNPDDDLSPRSVSVPFLNFLFFSIQ